MNFGIITPPISGHLHPFGALGRELMERGHTATVFHFADLEERARAEELEFVTIGSSDHPRGSQPELLAQLAKLHGLRALRFTVGAVAKTTEMMCREAPAAIRRAKIDALLVDQTEPSGGTIAEHLGIPFITICNALVMNAEPTVPPPFTPWSYNPSAWAQLRNRLGYRVQRLVMKPVSDVIARYRQEWKLARLEKVEDSFSTLAQISQQPKAFDFPRRDLPTSFHYVGPLRKAKRKTANFPWDKLDARPLVYASLGTLQNRRWPIFNAFAEACAGMDVQLAITHGGGLTEAEAQSFSGNPIVVNYAPQQEVLSRAALTLTHAGLNTVLDSLSHGVPMIAIPITYEQPAIAERIRWSGVGEVLPMKALNAADLKATIRSVLSSSVLRRNATAMREAIAEAGGVARAANLIESVLTRRGQPSDSLAPV
jgi:zeaxanthin glucosyltransferase